MAITLNRNEAILLTQPEELRHIANLNVDDAYLLIEDKRTTLFCDSRYIDGVKFKNKVRLEGISTLSPYLEGKRVGINFNRVSHATALKIEKLCGEMFDASGIIGSAMSVKSSAEIESIKRAQKITERAVKKALKKVYDGISELELKRIIETECIRFGAQRMSFDTIVAFGRNSAVPHHVSGERRLEEGDVVLIDVGCVVDGMCSDMTRTFCYKRTSEEFFNAYMSVISAQDKAIKLYRAGVSTSDADSAAREILGDYFTHSLGHGVGGYIHEYPTVSVKSDARFENGQVVTCEPGVYYVGKFGIRIEDMLLIDGDKPQNLTNFPKRLTII